MENEEEILMCCREQEWLSRSCDQLDLYKTAAGRNVNNRIKSKVMPDHKGLGSLTKDPVDIF